jgi:hypothetical protein
MPAMYDVTLNTTHSFFNQSPQYVRAVMENQCRNSIVLLTARKEDSYASLHPREMLFHSESGAVQQNERIFPSESFSYPGFIEFDAANKLVLTCCPTRRFELFETETANSTQNQSLQIVRHICLAFGF